jgi:hypothetical protein
MQKLRWLAAAVSSGLTFSSVKLRVISDQAMRAARARLRQEGAALPLI